MSGEIETHAVEFGQFGKDYEQAAEQVGISPAGIFVLATYADMVKTGRIDDPVQKTAQEQLLDIADKIESGGVKPGEQKGVAEQLRYLSQFIVMRPVPHQ